jgi:lipopolysaccharide heptosyltransferase I
LAKVEVLIEIPTISSARSEASQQTVNPVLSSLQSRRVLLIKPSALGDIVHSLPVLDLLRRRYPDAEIAWLIAPAFAPLVRTHPAGCEVIEFDRGGQLNAGKRGPAAWFDAAALSTRLAARRFDLVIDLQGLLRSALFTFGTMAPVRVGFAAAREGAPFAYTHAIESRGIERHAVERYLDIAEALGCGRGPVEYRFGLTDADRAAVDALLGEYDRPLAVLLPGTNWETKKWPIAHYATLAKMLERDGNRVVIAGAADVLPLAGRVPNALNLANKTSLLQLVALLERAAVVVANDSGPMHIASALGRPLVTIFGPTNPIRTGPHARLDTVIRLNIACSPCYSRKCSHTSCMHWLTPERVFEKVRATLSDQPAVAARGSPAR